MVAERAERGSLDNKEKNGDKAEGQGFEAGTTDETSCWPVSDSPIKEAAEEGQAN